MPPLNPQYTQAPNNHFGDYESVSEELVPPRVLDERIERTTAKHAAGPVWSQHSVAAFLARRREKENAWRQASGENAFLYCCQVCLYQKENIPLARSSHTCFGMGGWMDDLCSRLTGSSSKSKYTDCFRGFVFHSCQRRTLKSCSLITRFLVPPPAHCHFPSHSRADYYALQLYMEPQFQGSHLRK